MTTMAKMVNISDSPVTLTLGGNPGQQPQVITVEAGEAGEFPDGYCQPVQGAGNHILSCIVSQKSRQHGVPRLVRPDEADKGRARWERARPGGAKVAAPVLPGRPPAHMTPEALAAKPPPANESPVEAPIEAAGEIEAATTPIAPDGATPAPIAPPARKRRRR